MESICSFVKLPVFISLEKSDFVEQNQTYVAQLYANTNCVKLKGRG